MPAPLVGDELLGPVPAEHIDLFLDAVAPVGEVLVEGLVLHPVPADADTEPHPAAGEEVELGDLLRHQRGLALGEEQDRGGQFEGGGGAADEAEQHEGFVHGGGVEVDLLAAGSVGVATDHVVVDRDPLEAGRFEALHGLADGAPVGADGDVREHRPELHRCHVRSPVCWSIGGLSIVSVLTERTPPGPFGRSSGGGSGAVDGHLGRVAGWPVRHRMSSVGPTPRSGGPGHGRHHQRALVGNSGRDDRSGVQADPTVHPRLDDGVVNRRVRRLHWDADRSRVLGGRARRRDRELPAGCGRRGVGLPRTRPRPCGLDPPSARNDPR